MPFTPDHVHLEHATGRTFRLLRNLTYRTQSGHRYTAHAGLITDMATVPHSLWSVIAPFGQQSLPAILHDQECTDLRKLTPHRSRARRKQRLAVDSRFFGALLEQGVPRFRAAMLWSGASLGRYWEHGGYVQRLWLFIQLALGYGALMWGVHHLDEWTGWIAVAAPALAATVWGRSAPAFLLAQYPGLLIIAIGFAVFALSTIEWIPNIILGARFVEPTPKQQEIEEEVLGRHLRGRPFRGVGLPLGLRRIVR